MDITPTQTFLIALVSSLFVYTSYLLSKACYDEFEHKDMLKGVALFSTMLLVLVISIFLQEFLFLFLFIFYYSIHLITLNSYITKKLNIISLSQDSKFKIFRSISYIFMYITLFINPALLFFIAVFEFFNTSFTKFLLRFEMMCLFGFLLCVGVVLFV